MLMLIDTREPPPRPEPARRRFAWEPNWRLWRWVAATVLALVGAGVASGFVAYLFVCAMVACACQAICVVLPDTFGLHDYRQ